jgi:hypothetical protein
VPNHLIETSATTATIKYMDLVSADRVVSMTRAVSCHVKPRNSGGGRILTERVAYFCWLNIFGPGDGSDIFLRSIGLSPYMTLQPTEHDLLPITKSFYGRRTNKAYIVLFRLGRPHSRAGCSTDLSCPCRKSSLYPRPSSQYPIVTVLWGKSKVKWRYIFPVLN